MTQSAISHRIRLLEEHLGVKLFVRIHRQVVLTPPGQAFLSEVRDAMQRLSQAAANVSDQPVKKLRITVSPALAFTVLSPHLQEYFDRSGYVDLEIDTSARVLSQVSKAARGTATTTEDSVALRVAVRCLPATTATSPTSSPAVTWPSRTWPADDFDVTARRPDLT